MPVRKYVYDGDAVLQETDGAGATLTEYTRTGGGYGDLLSAYDGTSARYYEPDALGSTDALADQSQAVVDRWAYRAFGHATQTTGTDSTPFTWVGRLGYFADSETGLYLLGSGTRYYDPATAQFLSADPIGFASEDTNARRYSGSNPIRFVDPQGLKQELTFRTRKPATGLCAYETNNPVTQADQAGLIGVGMALTGLYSVMCAIACRAADDFKRIKEIWGFRPIPRGGGVVCFEGIKCACVFELTLFDKDANVLKLKPGDCPELDKCTLEHERKHFEDTLCPFGHGIEGAIPKPGKTDAELECAHRKSDVECTKKAIERMEKAKPANDRCIKAAKLILDEFADWIRKHCPQDKK